MEKLKRAVIKEELVALTGDFKKAIVLNQMIYWSERTKDSDKFMQDELKRSRMAMGRAEIEYAEKLEEMDLLSHGWIYKTAEELSEETMMGVSKSTMGTYLNSLVAKGWLDKRKNPKWKGDNTFQYRVNLLQIQTDLHNIGYALEGYPLLVESKNETSESNNRTPSSEIEQTVLKSNNQFGNRTTLPEITSEITSKTLEEEEEELITLGDVMAFINDQISKREITNKKTLDAIFEVAAKCRAVGTTDREAMENYCITIVEDKMKLFGQKQGTKAPRKDKAPTRTELIPPHMQPGYVAPTESIEEKTRKQLENEAMLKRLRE